MLQKYTIIFEDEEGLLNFESFEKKRDLRRKMRAIELESIRLITKGRLLSPKIKETLTV